MCAHAVRVAVQKLPGVDTVAVSLNEGVASVRFAAEHRISIEQVREIIRSNGFTPKEAVVRIAGSVSERDGQAALRLPGRKEPYLLYRAAGAAPPVLPPLGARVVIAGRVPETPRGVSAPPWLIIQEVETR
ncbi:MAG: heavy-metal-associated domain-containing protein [Longimicrobiales bacterium]